MIDSVIITDLSSAVSHSFKECKQNAWISVVDEQDARKISLMRNNFKKRGSLFYAQLFYDWSDEDNDPYIQKNIEELGPTKEKIQKIIIFIKSLVDSDKVFNLGINCYAGVSRSTAIGIIAMTMTGKTPHMATDYITIVRPEAWPNLRILRFASEILKQDLLTPVKTYIKDNKFNIYPPK